MNMQKVPQLKYLSNRTLESRAAGVESFAAVDGKYFALNEKNDLVEMTWSEEAKKWFPKVIGFLEDWESGVLPKTWKSWLYILLTGILSYVLGNEGIIPF